MLVHCVGDWEIPDKLDAPVSGSVIAAEAGTLTFMVLLLLYSNILKTHINDNTLFVMILGSQAMHLTMETKRTLIFHLSDSYWGKQFLEYTNLVIERFLEHQYGLQKTSDIELALK